MTKLNPYAWFAQVFIPGFYLAVFAAAAGVVAIGWLIWRLI
jgi:hypothetical protein